MTLPVITINGTKASELCDLYQTAALAVSDALEALAASAPNGRDYQTQGASIYAAARAEHSARLDRLQAVRIELETLAMHCADQV